MAYYNRKPQLLKTLDGFQENYANKYNFEVVIVNDQSDTEHSVVDIVDKYDFDIRVLEIPDSMKVLARDRDGNPTDKIINPGMPYNVGFKKAKGEIIIIQNPECYHVGDVLGHTLKYLNMGEYFSFATFACHNKEVGDSIIESKNPHKYIFSNHVELSKVNRNEHNWNLMWYNYPLNIVDDYKLGIYTDKKNTEISYKTPKELIDNQNAYSTGYHYCAAIYNKDLKKVKGFNKKYFTGYCYDDDEFVMRLKHQYGLTCEVIDPYVEKVCVIHQFHKRNASYNSFQKDKEDVVRQKLEKNMNQFREDAKKNTNNLIKNLLEEGVAKKNECYFKFEKTMIDHFLINNPDFSNVKKGQIYSPNKIKKFKNVPKIAFTYWDMSKMSFLHFLTLYTIKKQNPDWEIVLYYPKKRVNHLSWKSFENKDRYSSHSYLNEVKKLGIKIIEIDFEEEGGLFKDIPCYISEVTKSDYFRLKILSEVGGMWFDMDTFWINPIEDSFKDIGDNYLEDIHYIYSGIHGKKELEFDEYCVDYEPTSFFVLSGEKNLRSKVMSRHFCQYIMFSSGDSKEFKLLENSVWDNIDPERYESIGTPMVNKVLSNYIINSKYKWDKSFINIDKFSPYQWWEMADLFYSNDPDSLSKVENSSCIHWFNGAPDSKRFIGNFNHKNFQNHEEVNFIKILNKYLDEDDFSFLKNINYDDE